MSIKKMSRIIFLIAVLVIMSSILSLPFMFNSYKKAQTFEALLEDTGNALNNTSTALSEYLIFSIPRAKIQLALAAEQEDLFFNKLTHFSADYPLIMRLVQKHQDFHTNLEILFNCIKPAENNVVPIEKRQVIIKEISSQLFLLSSEISGYLMELSSLARNNFIVKSNILIGSVFLGILILSGF
ncbi:MAG: hypothetical protein KAR45_11950, partial [Desulfobacteraceae bacterium]|nr:hypothetical protein [Desulfobacteraceae bacterium]